MNEKQIAEIQTFRKTTTEVAAAHRALAVLLLVQGGDMHFSVYGIDHARRLKYAYLRHGIDAFLDKRRSNRKRVLTAAERQAVIFVLQHREPKDLVPGCESEQWSTYWLGQYILAFTGKRYKSKTSHYLLFKEAKLSFHLPGKVYERSDPETRATWIETTEPLLVRYWADPNTVILCEDEMVLTNATTTQRIWLPKGAYPPVLDVNTTKKRCSFYGFLNLKTGQQHTFTADWQNMYITAEILTKVRALYPKKKLILIWDNAGWHRGSEVQKWIEQDGNTQTIYFPPYTPDLNPQEHVWKAGRVAVTHNQHITNLAETAERFRHYLTNRTFTYELLGFRADPGGQV
ncbi:MAG: IS630 family transposase [Candidatus Saccharimonadales bacterium]